MFQRCLICTDFSDGLYRLLKFVSNLASGGIKQIVFLHCVPIKEDCEVPRVDKEKIEAAKARFAQELAEVPAGVEVVTEVLSGRPLDNIPKILETYDSEVILTGNSIRSLLQEKIFGSTTVGLGKLTSTPLTILRPQLISTYTREELALRCEHLYRYLLIPYNNSDSAQYLLERIKEIAKNRPENSLEKIMLCWVVDDAGRRGVPVEYKLQEATKKLEEVKGELEKLGLQVNTEVRQGNPLLETLDVAVDFDITSIAIGSVTKNNLFEWTTPSFANELLRRSWFPVVFFSPGK
ncbi:MAG: universal stress protein [Spirulinaceae cyanobacterium]